MKAYSEIFNEIKKCEKLKDYVIEKCEKEYTEVTQYNIETMIHDKIKIDLENIFGKNEEFKNMANILPVYLEHTETKNNYVNIKNLDSLVNNVVKSNIYDITNDVFNKNKNYDKNKNIEKDII